MTGALIILLVTVAVGIMLWVGDKNFRHRHGTPEAKRDNDSINYEEKATDEPEGGICCGRHLVCEKSLTPEPGEKIVYYDDEELDRFSGRESSCYSEEEMEEFREIMQTMRQEDLPGWARSLQLRGISFPLPLRDELFLLLEES